MAEIEAAFSSEAMRREKRAVAGNSVLASFVVTALKIVVGVGNGVAEARARQDEFGCDDADERIGDRQLDAGEEIGRGRRQIDQ